MPPSVTVLVVCSQGRRFVGLAQSFGPHLGYLVAPVLESLQPQIRAVAASIASQQETRRRSMSCALPPVEQLTVHDSAESLTSQLPSRFSPAGQQARQQRPPAPTGSGTHATPRMLSPFQTYSASATASSQPASPESQSSALQSEQQQDRAESGSGGSGRLDLSPAKTALDMSLLDVARLGDRIAHRQAPGASDSVSSVPRRTSGEPVRRLSAGESETAAIVAEKAAEALRRSSRSSELQLDTQPSTEYYPQQEAVIAAGSKGPAKPHRRPPLPLMRASSPLSVHGSEPSTSAMPRQMSLHLPETLGPQKHTQGGRAPSSLSPFQQSAFPKSSSQGGPAPTSGPFAQEGMSFTSPFATSAPFETEDDQSAASVATTAASLLPEGSVINMSSLLPPLPSQQQAFSPRRLSPLAVASLTASLPQEISSSAAAVLSAPMTSLQPANHYTGIPGLTMPSMLPASDTSMQTLSPSQQTGFTMSPAPYAEEQHRGHSQQQGYRLPPQLQSSSLLLQLLPAGSAQSLTALMSRQASDARPISRTASLNNDGSTSVSVSSPKRSLLNMSRAVSEQLHLSQGNRGAQRPFLADLQVRSPSVTAQKRAAQAQNGVTYAKNLWHRFTALSHYAYCHLPIHGRNPALGCFLLKSVLVSCHTTCCEG